MNNPAHSIVVLNCSGNANRPELSRTVTSRAVPYRTMQWKSAIIHLTPATLPVGIVHLCIWSRCFSHTGDTFTVCRFLSSTCLIFLPFLAFLLFIKVFSCICIQTLFFLGAFSHRPVTEFQQQWVQQGSFSTSARETGILRITPGTSWEWESRVELAEEPASVREPMESAAEPAPVREPTESILESAPVREPTESAPEPALVWEPMESAKEPTPVREPTESGPGAHGVRLRACFGPGAHRVRSRACSHSSRGGGVRSHSSRGGGACSHSSRGGGARSHSS